MEVTFPGDGITSVVGPNGCGKSNIVDSIRWVLGEQRVKQLRSDNMQDVIFSGTHDRPPLNFAEVSLIINNDKSELNSNYSEIQITRRVTRNGGTEYYLNNQECRLKDIHNLFMDTGMGASSYSLMEAKMIDSLLSNKAEERRQLFEEASGISKYKQQKKETVRQLEKTAQDLERVEDSLRHIKQSVSHFEKQAKKAEEWRRLTSKCKTLEVSLSYDKFQEYLGAFDQLERRIKDESSELESFQNKLATIETTYQEKKLLISEEESLMRETEQTVINRQLQVKDLNSEAEKLRERIAHQNDNLDKYKNEVVENEERLKDIDVERVEKAESIEEFQLEIENIESSQGNFEEALNIIRAKFDEVREKAQSISTELMSVIEEQGRIKSQYEKAMQAIDHFSRQKEQVESELSQLQENQVEIDESALELEDEIEALNENISLLEENIQSLINDVEDAQDESEKFVQQERLLENQKSSLESEQKLLQNLLDSNDTISGGAKALFEEKKDRLNGMLSDVIDVKSDYVDVVEYCLGEFAQLILTSDFANAEHLIEYLEENKKGRAEIFITGFSQKALDIDVLSHPKIIGNLGQLVTVQGDYQSIIEALLGKYFLAYDWGSACALARENAGKDLWFVTQDLKMIHTSGWLRGGKGKSDHGGILKQKARLEEVTEQLTQLEESIIEVQLQREEKAEFITAIKENLNEKQEESKDLREQVREKETQVKLKKSNKENFDTQIGNLQRKLVEIEQQLEPFQKALEEENIDVDAFDEKRSVLEEKQEAVKEELQELELQKSSEEDYFRESQNILNTKRRELDSTHSKLDYLNQLEVNIHETIEKRRVQITEVEDFVTDTFQRMEELHDDIEAQNEMLSIEEEKRDEAREIYDAKKGDLDIYQEEIKTLHGSINQKTQSVHEAEMKKGELLAKAERIRERIFETYEVDLGEDKDIERVDYDLSSVNKEINELKKEIKKLGNVNPEAMDDFNEERKKLQDVEKQFKDLDSARASLERTIDRLDNIARERFLETFEIVRKNFQDVFESLMKNGEAKLTLEEGVDPLEAKIDINARPTGKKMRGVTLLSGGERALTATALLFALYMVKPSPFCILDEVDAPLDDANIGRFVQLLRRFSRQTQFIVITHNKRTMAASDRLYGVTQEIKGISRISSVQLDDAVEFAG